MRPFATLLLLIGLAAPFASPANAGPHDAAFAKFLSESVVPAALQAGVRENTLSRELTGLRPKTDLPGLVGPHGKGKAPEINFQAEFKEPSRYFRDSQFNALVGPGQRLLKKYGRDLKRIEDRYGVPRRILAAIWARESGYGKAKIPHDAIQVLATRAFMGERRDYFRQELISALKILQSGDVPRSVLRSSWGGALGQPQFMPTSYLKYAVDFDGDGHRDIWRSDIDTLASIANYLSEHGWMSDRDWGYEAAIPDTISCALEGPDNRMAISKWASAGVTRANGRPFPVPVLKQDGNILMPAGRYGPAFLATENFYVLKTYNESDTYALFVGHLADRYSNNKGFVGTWKPTRKTTRGAVRNLQKVLQQKGHDVGGADGLIGFKTRRSIGKDQEAQGFFPTCWVG